MLLACCFAWDVKKPNDGNEPLVRPVSANVAQTPYLQSFASRAPIAHQKSPVLGLSSCPCV